ncbi:MAG: TraR/DksA C4-type zinc finger protein [Bryobacterales bacterium]|nr:TraR/DksA C4-type zinc finger protein [Bryobacterales bacterium]
MKTFAEYEKLAETAHGHLCAGQVLGIRLAVHGLGLLGIEDPTGKDRKRLVTYVEIDRCATDAIGLVTGCRLGKRSLKFMDFGKMAATFVDLHTGLAVRIVAKESSRERAKELYPEVTDKTAQQLKAYREMAAEELFDVHWVKVQVAPREMPGFKGPRIICVRCGEGISFQRELIMDGHPVCRACAGERYYHPLAPQ